VFSDAWVSAAKELLLAAASRLEADWD